MFNDRIVKKLGYQTKGQWRTLADSVKSNKNSVRKEMN